MADGARTPCGLCFVPDSNTRHHTPVLSPVFQIPSLFILYLNPCLSLSLCFSSCLSLSFFSPQPDLLYVCPHSHVNRQNCQNSRYLCDPTLQALRISPCTPGSRTETSGSSSSSGPETVIGWRRSTPCRPQLPLSSWQRSLWGMTPGLCDTQTHITDSDAATVLSAQPAGALER